MAAADIEGVGEQLVWRLGASASSARCRPYRLTKEQLLELDGFQESSASNVIDAIAALGRCRSAASSSASTSRTSAGSRPQSLARHFGTVERSRRDARRSRWRARDRPRARGGDRGVVRRRGEPALVAELWPLLDVREEEPPPEGR
jgi:NAD-dependent DNA ligase